MIIELQKTLVSSDILEEKFVCKLNACKGFCCVEGDSGAPLGPEELSLIDGVYPLVEPYMASGGVKAIKEQGRYLKSDDSEWETPLADGKECAYAVFDEKGIAFCAFEKAYNDGHTPWRKPISCHLYPIRLQECRDFTVLNYHRWGICHAACSHGEQLQMPVFRFLREPLIRKFGQGWHDELEGVYEQWLQR